MVEELVRKDIVNSNFVVKRRRNFALISNQYVKVGFSDDKNDKNAYFATFYTWQLILTVTLLPPEMFSGSWRTNDIFLSVSAPAIDCKLWADAWEWPILDRAMLHRRFASLSGHYTTVNDSMYDELKEYWQSRNSFYFCYYTI